MANGEDVYEGICDYCGEHADANSTDCNFLSCSFAQCEGGLYHQECLYQFLKANRLEKVSFFDAAWTRVGMLIFSPANRRTARLASSALEGAGKAPSTQLHARAEFLNRTPSSQSLQRRSWWVSETPHSYYGQGQAKAGRGIVCKRQRVLAWALR
jgi:hypothetical protein